MEMITTTYDSVDKKILKSLDNNKVLHRPNASAGLWLMPLVGISALATILREDNSYSEICLLIGITGVGLVLSSICFIAQLTIDKSSIKDFQIIYFLPATITSMLYLLWASKGLLVSVSWGLSVGSIGTWGVLQLMSLCPKCFTLGEATTVTHGIILFLLSTCTNLPQRYHLPPLHDDDIATIILQVGIIFVGLVCALCIIIPKIRETKYFYITTFGILIIGVVPLLHILLDQSPLLWMIYFIFGDLQRMTFIIYAATCLLVGSGFLMNQISSDTHAGTAGRKIFHLLAVLVYIPGLMFEPTLLYLASGIIMGIFMMLELLRFLNIPPFGKFLQLGFSVFADEKDSLISLTPIYLLIGMSFPLWMPTTNLDLLTLLSGVLTIGIGDASASLVGSKWGKTKWNGCEKSIEGTVACILSQLIVIYLLAASGFIYNLFSLIRITLVVIGVSFIEARTDQVDNLILPLIFYICLII